MLRAVLKYEDSDNLGDEIQSLAAKAYFEHVDVYIDREYLNEYKGEKAQLIMNGWYMLNPDNWPPSDDIDPLFISFHANSLGQADEKIINSTFFDYYKKYEPIGCRDHRTVRLFEKIGIKAYFSSCLTLTLPRPNVEKNENIIIVDPFRNRIPSKLVKKYMLQFIPMDEHKNIKWIKQDYPKTDHAKRFELAQELLNEYAAAKLVITSRIHCALPCLAFGTPVIFIDSGFDTVASRERFEGILDLMYTLDSKVFPFPTNVFSKAIFRLFKPFWLYNVKNKPEYNWKSPPQNKSNISQYVSDLKSKVKSFLRDE